MKIYSYLQTPLILLVFGLFGIVSAQENQPKTPEILTNAEVVSMAQNNLGKNLIVKKIKESKGAFDVSVGALISLKQSGVSDEILEAMMEKSRALREKSSSGATIQSFSDSQPIIESVPAIIKNAADALRSAKTVAIEKSTVNPSRQALEKELLKRKDWQKLNLNIVRYKDGADLRVEIGFVPLSIITHRYVFRVYDNRSGTVIAAGETTSWGSLAKNLARNISTELNGIDK
ncbi:MAG: hypothetical protein LH472_06420 [Pyrinomonadaceae bacterium]|nr:hypothetical protein [Pyrinomonadaceae bacterium]